MIKKTILSLSLLMSLNVAFAAPTAPQIPADLNQDPLTNEARKSLQSNKQDIDNLILKGRYNQLSNQQPETQLEAAVQLPTSDQCLPISGVYLKGITLLKAKDLALVTAMPKECITSTDLNRLVLEITKIYIKLGYVTARASFIAPDQNNNLGVQIIEGFVEDIVDLSGKLDIEMLFPKVKNKPLNLRDLEQGLEQANRLQSNSVTLEILPGSKIGGSIVTLKNVTANTTSLMIAVDNFGQESTGKITSQVSLSVDDLLGLSDFANISVSHTLNSLNDSFKNRYNRSISGLYSVPYGYSTVSFFASTSQYLNSLQLQLNEWELKGQTKQLGLKGDIVYYRDNSQIDGIFAQFTHKQVNNYFAGSRILMNSPTLSIAEFGLTHMQLFDASQVNLSLSIERGTDWFIAEQEQVADINTEFTKGKASINFNHYFAVFEKNILFNAFAFGQYSKDYLPGVEWINLTDRTAVQGFDKNSLASDSGWYLKNAFSHDFSLAKGVMTLKVGADIGGLAKSSSLAVGGGLGCTYRYKQFYSNLNLSRGWVLGAGDFAAEELQLLANIAISI